MNTHSERSRKLIAAIESVKKLAEELTAPPVDHETLTLAEQLRAEASRAMQQAVILSLAYIAEEPVPVSIFRPFACSRQFSTWEKQGLITLSRRNRKNCCVPSQFFCLWRTLADKPRPGNMD